MNLCFGFCLRIFSRKDQFCIVVIIHTPGLLAHNGLKNGINAVNDVFGASEVFVEVNDFAVCFALLKALIFFSKNIGIRQTKAVDALFDIAHHKQIVSRAQFV